MNNPSNISHPLKNRAGTSQRTRIITALDPNTAPIDGKTIADRLYLISEYARHINFFQYENNEIDGEFQKLGDWVSFFKESLPFQLGVLSKTSIADIESQFVLLSNEFKINPSQQALESILNFIYNELILPPTRLYGTILLAENSFGIALLSILKSSFLEPLKSYITLYNASITFLCVCKRNFNEFMTEPWELKVDEVYALDGCIKKVKKGKKEALLLAGDKLDTIFFQMLSGMQDIVASAPDYIDESLLPLKESLQKKHQPHLALLFTFLELFAQFQGNLNELSKKHLDFFYQEVLKMIPKEAVPDKAHVIFEIAKHLEEYPLSKGLLLKDSKDINKQDIEFSLDQEIILDKANIKEVRTFSLPKLSKNDGDFIEGIYVAPISNSLDGIGKKFKKDQPNNWATLGAKYSKYIPDGNSVPNEHPNARIGFVLSSPVLLLQEGKRTISISLTCQHDVTDLAICEPFDDGVRPTPKLKLRQIASTLQSNLKSVTILIVQGVIDICELSDAANNYLSVWLLGTSSKTISKLELDELLQAKNEVDCTDIFSEDDIRNFWGCLKKMDLIHTVNLFQFSFSGEKEWLHPDPDAISTTIAPTAEGLQIDFIINLKSDFPAIVFYDEKKLMEPFHLEKPYPLVKIELNEDIKIGCESDPNPDPCCLKIDNGGSKPFSFSAYHYLNGLTLKESTINVEVCGVKNLIVQNDDNLQDVNKPIYPFGPRPKLDAAFVIGSKEIFCKNWQSFRLGVEWKDRPEEFEDYYEAYNLEDGVEIDNDVFKMEAGVLDESNWKKQNGALKKIFIPKDVFSPCPTIDIAFNFNGYTWDRSNFPISSYAVKSMPVESLTPLSVNSRKAYLRLRLKGEDFQHDSYAFVLAKQMMALANIIDAKSAERVRDDLSLILLLSNQAILLTGSVISKINDVVNQINHINVNEIPRLLTLAQSIENHLNFVKANYSHASSPGKVASALDDVNDIITEIGNVAIAASIFGQIDLIKDNLDLIKGFIEDNAGFPINNRILDDEVENNIDSYGLQIILVDIRRRIVRVTNILDIDKDVKLPNEPYTPVIKSLYIDYTATADNKDIDLIHLYPFENTSKFVDIEQEPTLFPFFNDEGNLFIGIEQLTPGGNLSLLFQLAEATADSESDRAEIDWSYLSNNNWTPLRPGFDVISDGTDGLTVSGIVSIAIPESISKTGNTVMPNTLNWIKISTAKNVKSIAETIGIHTQAVAATAKINELNDTSRLETALPAGSISKLVEGDFSVKKVEQLYDGFDGRKPEVSGHFYTRVSEHLKHKGKGIMINDYEKIVLEEFPKIYKAKCISHTMGLSANLYRRDLEIAPGYVIVAVIPDLTKLKSGSQLEPKAPVSLIEKIGDHLREKTSAFARLKIMNPRYEHVDVGITVRLYRGKSQNFYAKKLKEDITLFLAPWFLGDSEKLAFGQVVLFSDIVGFVEQLDYVDFIVDLVLSGTCGQNGSVIKPQTARSILTSGTICVDISEEDCDDGARLIESNIEMTNNK